MTTTTGTNSTTRGLVHRLRQARAVALRAQLAMTGAQVLFWVALVGVLLGLALRMRRHWAHRDDAPDDELAPQVFSSPTTTG
jgi:hypothetical protein